MKHALTASALAAVLVLAGCASAPDAPPELLEARAAVQAAERESAVLAHAPLELRKATTSLARANSLLSSREPMSEVITAAYVAKQQARTAQALARAKTDEDAIAGAEADRERARADVKAAEARRAQARASSAQAQASMAESRALTAEQQAAAAQQQAATATASASAAQQQAQALQQQLRELQVRQTERGQLVTLGDVLFEFNRAEIKPTAQSAMQKLADFLKKHPDRHVLIEGHTDNVGSDAYNEQLSRRRAEAVGSALMALGVPQPRVSVIGYGESYPVADNGSATNRALNRRVEVYISDNNQPVPPRTAMRPGAQPRS